MRLARVFTMTEKPTKMSFIAKNTFTLYPRFFAGAGVGVGSRKLPQATLVPLYLFMILNGEEYLVGAKSQDTP